MGKKKLLINIIACLVSFITTIGVNFFLTPYIIDNLGTEAYGYVSLANNFVNYASIITIALNSVSSRFISISIFKDKKNEACKYFTSTFIANIIIILILFIPSIICVYYLDTLISIPNDLIFSVKGLFFLVFVNFFVSLVNAIYSVSTYASNKMELQTLRNMESGILKVVIMIFLFYIIDANLIIVGFSTLVATTYLLIFNVYYKKRFLPFLKIKKIYFEFKKILEILSLGIWNTVTRVGQVLTDGLDLLITNIFISPLAMGQLSIVKTISASVTLLSTSLTGIFQPNITNLYANEDEKIIEETKFTLKIVSLFTNIFLVGIICFGFQFYRLWLPEENHKLLILLTTITLVGIIVGTSVNALFSIFTITNKLKVNSLLTCFVGVFNILIVYIILKLDLVKTPVIIVASVSVVTSIIKNLTFTPIYAAKCLNAKKTTFYPVIFKTLGSSLIMSLIFLFINKMLIIDSWIKLICVAIVCAVIGFAVTAIILFNKNEIKKIIISIKNKLKKESQMENNIYVCHTLFHVFITLIKTLKNNMQTSIVIANTIPDCQNLINKLEKSKIFEEVFFYDEIKVKKFLIEEKIETKIFRKDEMIKLFEKHSKINFKKYKNVYMYNDWTTVGAYLMDSKIRYHLIEDGLDGFYYLKGNLRNETTFLNPNFKYRIRRVYKKALNIGYDYFGQSKNVIDIEVNDKSKIYIKNNNVIEVRKEDLYASLTDKEKMIIYNIFINEDVKIKKSSKKVLILTQPLFIDNMVDSIEDQKTIYKNFIDKYIKEYAVYIKPHPRDTFNYEKINKNIIIIDKNIPIEILNFNKINKFEKAITITSSSIKTLNFVDEKIEYGFDYLNKYKRSR